METDKSSEISIAYAYDKDLNGGSEWMGGLEWYRFALRKHLLHLFESEFIDKLDKELNQKHSSG